MRRLTSIAAPLALFALAGAPAKAEELKLRVVSFNVWGLPWGISTHREERAAGLGPALAALKPDLVALQEVWVPEDGARIAGDLARAGLEHHHHESEGLLGSGLLIASRFPIESVRFTQFRLGGKPHKPYRGDYYARKGLLEVRVATPLGTVVFADTHLHARYGSSEYVPLQISQAIQAADALGNHGERPPERREDPARPPLILCGDINSTRDAVPFRLLCARAGLEPVPADLRIDWVLTRHGGAVNVRATRVRGEELTDEVDLPGGVRTTLSDHPCVVADLRLWRGAAPAWDPKAAQARYAAVAATALPLIEGELAKSRDHAASSRRRVVLYLALAGVLFGLDRLLRRRKGKAARGKASRLGCLLPGLSLVFLHLATWAAYFAAVYEPWHQSGLSEARRALGAE